MRIDYPIQQLSISSEVNSTDRNSTNKSTSFKSFLNNAIQNANDLQLESQKLNDDLAIGATDNIHQVMVASEKAEIALQFTAQIRSKLLDAYHEIMRMPI